ncbi:hypothetical protein GJA_3857 [Janthinobacterium agaricidamnosum NBRC 102515 = DSM 9628]|uniref:Uncharacterized protein n=1 Tax=Janthinobacterium agaricidamnosum NBRC 102515 = DSM 9628 TaxID=1349767 RepID=W0VAU8_9BURK|nr:hypothetical protein GJA_3857 [Janthinobacterium agaricidamnosum NBRC 102515 = DSM 9628]
MRLISMRALILIYPKNVNMLMPLLDVNSVLQVFSVNRQ